MKPTSNPIDLFAVTIQAHLHRLHLQSPEPERLVDFYVQTYGMHKCQVPTLAAVAPGRQVMATSGVANQLHYFLYSLETDAAWSHFKQRAAQVPQAHQADMSALRQAGYSAPFLTVDQGVKRYMQWLDANNGKIT